MSLNYRLYTAQQSIYLAGDEKANIDEVYDQTTVNSRSRVESSQICLFVCVCVCVCVTEIERTVIFFPEGLGLPVRSCRGLLAFSSVH